MMLRVAMIVMSFAIHGALAYVSINRDTSSTSAMSFEEGTGNDAFRIENGIGIEGFIQEGEALETVEANEQIAPVSVARPQLEEIKPVEEARELPEETEIIQSINGPEQEAIPVPDEKPEEVQQAQVATLEQLEQPTVALEEKRAGEKQEGGDPGLKRQYLGQVRSQIERANVNPRSSLTGTVLIRFAVAATGELISKEVISSSGSSKLDNAAIASLEKAAPFPPFPKNLGLDKIVEVIPYRFTIRRR